MKKIFQILYIFIFAILINNFATKDLFAVDCSGMIASSDHCETKPGNTTQILNQTITTYTGWPDNDPSATCCYKACILGSSIQYLDGEIGLNCYCPAGYEANSTNDGCAACINGAWASATMNDCDTCPSGYTNSDNGRDAQTDCYKTCTAYISITNGTWTNINSGNKAYAPSGACTYNLTCSAGIPSICVNNTSCDTTDITYNSSYTCQTSASCSSLPSALVGIYTSGTATYTGAYPSGSWNISACFATCVNEPSTDGHGHWVPDSGTVTTPGTCTYNNDNLDCDIDYFPSDTVPDYNTTTCINSRACSIDLGTGIDGTATYSGDYPGGTWNYSQCTKTETYDPVNAPLNAGSKTCKYTSGSGTSAIFNTDCTFLVSACNGGYYYSSGADCTEVSQGYYSVAPKGRAACSYGATTWDMIHLPNGPMTTADSITDCVMLKESNPNATTFCNSSNCVGTSFKLPVHVYYYNP